MAGFKDDEATAIGHDPILELSLGDEFFLTPTEFANKSRLSIATVRRRLKDGSLVSFQPGGSGTAIRIPASELKRLSQLQEDSPYPSRETSQNQTEADSLQITKNHSSKMAGPRPLWMK